MTKRDCWIGRFQPLHLGHEWCFSQSSNPLLVLVRDIPPDAANPFTTEQTIEMIRTALADKDAIVMAIPDIASVNWGRGVGYSTIEHRPPSDVATVSATEIRRQVLAGQDGWKTNVNPAIWHLVERYMLMAGDR